MGLDILGASRLTYVGPIPSGDERERLEEELNAQGKEFYDVYFPAYENDPDWPTQLGDTEPGLYEYGPGSERHEFRAGSYGYYNVWREHLSRMALGVKPADVWAEPERFAGRPFADLINFTDCDGRIGTRVSAGLAADFRAFAGRAEAFAATIADDRGGFLSNYRDFARAFELAADGGALTFC